MTNIIDCSSYSSSSSDENEGNVKEYKKKKIAFDAYVERTKLMDLFTDLFWQCFLKNAENPKKFLIEYLGIASKNKYEETIGNLKQQNSKLKFKVDQKNQQIDILVESAIQKQNAQPKRRKTEFITKSSTEIIYNQPSKRRRHLTAHAINALENDESSIAKLLKGNKETRRDEYSNKRSDVATTSRGSATRRTVSSGSFLRN